MDGAIVETAKGGKKLQALKRAPEHATLKAALSYLSAGRSVIPTGGDKIPVIRSWRQYQERLPTKVEVRSWFRANHSVAVIGGKVSGNLLMIDQDHDPDREDLLDRWRKELELEAPGLYGRLVVEKTQNHGYHIAALCPDVTLGGSQKLALRSIDVTEKTLAQLKALGIDQTDGGCTPEALSKIKIAHGHKAYQPRRAGSRYIIVVTLIETKGEGGYCVVAPSPGYELIQGSWDAVPVVTPTEYEALISCARRLTEYCEPSQVNWGPAEYRGDDTRPGTDFNERCDLAALLVRHGWKVLKQDGPYQHVLRPGKDGDQKSASIVAGKILHVFSGNASPFAPGGDYPPFVVYALLEHNGDFSAAAKALAEQGHGKRVESGEEKWSTPLDIFGSTSLAGTPELPFDSLPPVIAEYAWDEAERIGVTPSMVAMPSLVGAAAAIDDAYRIQPKERDQGWTERANLWICGIADIGTGKSPAEKAAVTALTDIERDLYRRYAVEKEAYDRQMEVYRGTRKKHLTERPEVPTEPRLVVEDFTLEALADVLAVNPRGVFCVRDELTGWFASFDLYRNQKGNDRALWLELWNGGPKFIDRIKTGRGRIYVPNWSSCLYGGIQPEPMRRLMGKIDDDGLVQRFIPFYGAKAPEVDRERNEQALCRYVDTIRHLWKMIPAPGKEPCRFSPEAQRYRRAVEGIADAAGILEDSSRAFKGHLAKWRGYFARLSLTYHMIEAASRREPQPEGCIDENNAGKVARFMSEYCLPNAARFYMDLTGPGHIQHSRWIAGHILAHNLGKISRRRIGRVYHELRDDEESIAKAMLPLVVYGWAKQLDGDKRTWPTKWVVNPSVHTRFAARAEMERKQRGEQVERIRWAVKFFGLDAGEDTDAEV
jgi:hypothetical protein